MRRTLVILIALCALSAGNAFAQDARAVLLSSVKAMGGENLKTILYNADLYTPPAQGAAGAAPNAATRTLYENMKKLKLDVAQHMPTHGRVGTGDELLKMFAKGSN